MAEITVHYQGPIILRAEARELGETRFFTGGSCPFGHVAQHMVSNGICVVCLNQRNLAYQLKNRAKNRLRHAAYQRAYRQRTPLNAEQRAKDSCRSYANVYKRRGHLIQRPCEDCGAPGSVMHHPDYSRPLEVVWLCPPCHQRHHRLLGQPELPLA